MIKRAPSLVDQVQTHLKQRIVNAEFDDGRIPAETHLASELNVSRNTIRDALSRLEMEGVIYRRQGAGTFVNQAVRLVKTRLEEIVPYETLIQTQGYRPTVELLAVSERPAKADIAQSLAVASDSALLSMQKRYLADHQPVILSRISLPKSLITKSYTPDELLLPVFELFRRLCQQELAYYLTELLPVIADDELAATLDLPQPATALMSFDEIGYNQANEPIVSARSYFRHDLLHLRLIRHLVGH